jgi:hypothetical protein
MNEVTQTLPDAWITEDGVLFFVAKDYPSKTVAFESVNKVLQENSYDERVGVNSADQSYVFCWVDPEYVTAEQWPDSAVSAVFVPSWVKLHWIHVEDILPPREAPEQWGNDE